MVITTIQVLGQTSFGFELSIAQILVSLVTCAVIDVVWTMHDRHEIAWPASALLTGNGIALLLRVSGTEHGDWWSLRGAWIFAATGALGIVLKHVVRTRDGHLFNPSNIGLVVCFAALGTDRVNPQDLWWGPLSPALVAAELVIIVGGLVIIIRQRLLAVSIAFAVSFAFAVGVVAASGHDISVRWHVGPVGGWSYWWTLTTSPEILIFLFFMITDPRTTPKGQVARVTYGAAVGLLAAGLGAWSTTEFATKVSILAALTLVCVLRPAIEAALPAAGSNEDALGASLKRAIRPRTALRGAGAGLLFVVGLVAVGHANRVESSQATEVFLPPVPSNVDAAAVPPVSIDPAVGNAGATVSARDSVSMVREVVATLLGQSPRVFHLDGATIVLVRDPKRRQAAPQLGVHVTGTEIEGSSATPFDHTYVVTAYGDRYVVSDSGQ